MGHTLILFVCQLAAQKVFASKIILTLADWNSDNFSANGKPECLIHPSGESFTVGHVLAGNLWNILC